MRVGKRRKDGTRKREKRRKLSRDELLDYLRRNDFRSSRKLTAGRKPGDPTVADYRREFGQWSVACEKAFGAKPFSHEITHEYLVKVVVQFGLWTREKYEAAHKERPEIVPTYVSVIREFGEWSTLIHFAERYDARHMMEMYMRLSRKIGRNPTVGECREQGIDKRKLEKLFGGKEYFRQNVEMMLHHEK